MDNKFKIVKYYISFILSITCILFYFTCYFDPVSKKDFMSFGQKEDKKDKDKEKKDTDLINNVVVTEPDQINNVIENKPDPINNNVAIKNENYIISSNGIFSFDLVDVSKRELPVTFTINNIGDKDLLLIGSPILSIDNTDDFEVNYSDLLNKSNKIEVNNSGYFTIRFKSSATDGKNKVVNVNIKNNLGNDYNFTIHCKCKRSGREMITGSTTWTSPCYGKATIYLAGGGGGAGRGYKEFNGCGGGGGGSGSLKSFFLNSLNIGDIYTVVIGKGGVGRFEYRPGGRGGNSQFIDKDSNILLEAEGGFGGDSATDTNPGLGGTLNGMNGTNNGGDGGFIILKGQNMGYGTGGVYYNATNGKSAPHGSGGGGGGGGGGPQILNGSNGNGSGGDGGAGFLFIEWTGFTN